MAVSPPCTLLSDVRCSSTAGPSGQQSVQKDKKEKKKKEFQRDLLHLPNGEVAHERSIGPFTSYLNGYRR